MLMICNEARNFKESVAFESCDVHIMSHSSCVGVVFESCAVESCLFMFIVLSELRSTMHDSLFLVILDDHATDVLQKEHRVTALRCSLLFQKEQKVAT